MPIAWKHNFISETHSVICYLSLDVNTDFKIINSYWIENGKCNYMQVGCNFKHEIPADEEIRTKIGMRGVPGWLRNSPAEYRKYWPQAQQALPAPEFKREPEEHTDFSSEAPPKRSQPSSSPFFHRQQSEPNKAASVGSMSYRDVERTQSGRVDRHQATGDLEEGRFDSQDESGGLGTRGGRGGRRRRRGERR